MEWFSAFGTIVTIGSAIFAFLEAQKAKEAASQSQKIKTQMINQRKTSELSELKPLLAEAINCCKHYSTSGSSSLVGTRLNKKEDEARKIQSLIDKIMEFSEYFHDGFAGDFYDSTDESLQKFLDCDKAEDIKKHGKELHKKMVDFSSVLRKSLNDKKEATVE